jgi:hypothetical protein
MATGLLHWMITGLLAAVHPFYISMTDINYNTNNKTLEVSVRIFTDDLEECLRRTCNCKVELMKPVDKPGMDKLVSAYINNHLQVKIDGQPATLVYAGYQQEDGSTWSYFEVKNVPAIKKLQVNNWLLHDYKTEQVNMVHVKANGLEKTEKLDYPQRVLNFF